MRNHRKMKNSDLKQRTKDFALKVIDLVEALPSTKTAEIIGKQLIRSGTSVGANYRSANRARSTADFIFKMGIVEEEADESSYWIELLVERSLISKHLSEKLITEANELVAIAVASINTARNRKRL